MLDVVPPKIALLGLVALVAAGPGSYVWKHVAHDPARQEIARPPEDLSWRSDRLFYRNVVLLVLLGASAVFIFTPQAAAFAQSDYFVPVLLSMFSSVAIGTSVAGYRDGTISPLSRGSLGPYDRDEQPRRYWASLAWNVTLSIGLLALSYTVVDRVPAENCTSDEANFEQIEDCDKLLADNGLSREERGRYLGARGRIYHRLQDHAAALADYSAAIDLLPDDSYALYNRGLIHHKLGDIELAFADYSRSLELRPDNAEGYLNRGMLNMEGGQFDAAEQDFVQLYTRDPELKSLGSGPILARNALGPKSRAQLTVLRTRAIKAREQGNDEDAIVFLNEALAIDPEDAVALRMRGDAYWALGKMDLARDDDDRLADLTYGNAPVAIAVH